MSEPSYGEIVKELIAKTENELRTVAQRWRVLLVELKRYQAILKDWEERMK